MDELHLDTSCMMTTKPKAIIRPKRLHQLLRKLIDIYSPSGKEEDILSYLDLYLKRRGLSTVHQPVDGHRYNLLVLPPDRDPKLVLVGHIDTVASHELEHYGYEEKGDMISGLGSADMKGGCAAMIEAYATLWENGLTNVPTALALLVGEEEDGDGAKRLVHDFYCPWAIIGEPTDMQPCLSDYGYIEVQITTKGRRMHASLANHAQNPIETMLRLLLRIPHYVQNKRPEMVFNIRDLSSSKAGFAVPDRCDAWIDIHLPPTASLGAITMELEELVGRDGQETQDSGGSMRFTTIHSGYELPEKGPIVAALKQAFEKNSIPWEPQAFRSHSDANLLWAAGMKTLLLGPGQLERAHVPDEAVSFSQVSLAAQVYLDLLLVLCASDAIE